jgi:hypothetical protein
MEIRAVQHLIVGQANLVQMVIQIIQVEIQVHQVQMEQLELQELLVIQAQLVV